MYILFMLFNCMCLCVCVFVCVCGGCVCVFIYMCECFKCVFVIWLCDCVSIPKEKLRKFLIEHIQNFSHCGKAGPTTLVKHKIDIADSKPIFETLECLPIGNRELVKKTIKNARK